MSKIVCPKCEGAGNTRSCENGVITMECENCYSTFSAEEVRNEQGAIDWEILNDLWEEVFQG